MKKLRSINIKFVEIKIKINHLPAHKEEPKLQNL